MDARALRRRRRAYARRARLGFEGYRVGGGRHLFQAVLRPMRAVTFAGLAAAAAGAAWAALIAALAAAGGSAAAAVALATTVAGGGWLLAGVARFWHDVRQVRRLRPPDWPGGTGVHEPRRPSPDAGELRAFRFPPPAPGPTVD